ncbi:hypothetical protein B5S33_g302 [[Candida] boidinii]|nr:hypothetical protein B5S30_g2391 [[Candida] boidinii]OWB81683.1 hypothetical protein B5S33_g302 [[Candida] boidinii]
MTETLDITLTAEGVTRYLRSKDAKFEQIYTLSTDLIDGKYNDSLYFPDMKKFIFELLCDRLSQKKFQELRLKPQIWQLFMKSWTNFTNHNDKIIRNRIFNGVKFNEIIIQSLKKISDETNKSNLNIELISSIIDSVFLIIDESRLQLTNDQNAELISILLDISILLKEENEYELRTQIIDLSCKIYFFANKNSSTKYAKNTVQFFATELLPKFLIAKFELLHKQDKSVNIIESIIIDCILKKDSLSHLEGHITFFLQKSKAINLISQYLIYIFKLIVTKLNEISDVEKYFKLFTSTFPDISGSLLECIVDTNKTLSTEFLKPYVISSIEKLSKNTNDLNSQNLILQSIERNSEIGSLYANDILNFSINSKIQRSKEFLLNLLNCFIKSREILEFFQLLRDFALSKIKKSLSVFESNSFKSPEFNNQIIGCIKTLSQVQLVRLVEKLINEFDNNIQLNSILLTIVLSGLLEGVTGCSNSSLNKSLISNIQKVRPLIMNIMPRLNGDAKQQEHLSNLRFVVYSIYDLEEISNVSESDLIKSMELYKAGSYHTIFRILEQSLDDSIKSSNNVKNIIDNFTQYFIESPQEFKISIFKRWFVLLNFFCEPSHLKTICSNAIKSIDQEGMVEILSNPIIFEQEILMHEIINSLILKYKEGDENLIVLINIIPVYCFKKYQKEQLLNAVAKTIQSKSDLDDMKRRVILNILVQPTFSSKIETDISSLLKLFANTSDGNINELDMKIAKTILSLHLQQKTEKINKAFITKSIEKLEKKLKSSKFEKKNMNALYLSLYFIECEFALENKLELSSDLAKSFVQCSKKCLFKEEFFSDNDVNWILSSLAEIGKITQLPYDDVKETIKLVWKNNNVQLSLFKLVCVLESNNGKYDYLMALYINSRDKNQSSINYNELSNSIGYSFKNIEEYRTFEQTWIFLLQVFQEVNDVDEIYKYFELLCIMMSHIPRFDESQDMIQSLVIQSLSCLLDYIDIFTNDSSAIDSIIGCLEVLRNLISGKHWCLTQYSIEQILCFTIKSEYIILASDHGELSSSEQNSIESLYISVTQVLSNLILFQRFRLSNRYHIIISAFIPLIESLFVKKSGDNHLSTSKACATSFQRLMSNLCEPSGSFVSGSSHSVGDSSASAVALTSTMSTLKARLRKSLPSVILNYISLAVRYNMNLEIKEVIVDALFLIFDILTMNELKLINSSLDSHGRTLFKSFYDDYKKYGKWRED